MRGILKISKLFILSLGLVSVATAQESEPRKGNSLPFSIELSVGYAMPSSEISVDIQNSNVLETVDDIKEEIYGEFENSPRIGGQVNVKVFKGFSVYGNFFSMSAIPVVSDYSNTDYKISTEALTQLIEGIPNISASARVETGEWKQNSFGAGVRYDYKIEKFRISPMVGVLAFNQSSPNTIVNAEAKATIGIFPITVNMDELIRISDQKKTALGINAGLGVYYDVTDNFFVGVNYNYSKFEVEYDMAAEVTLPTIPIGGITLPNIPDQEFTLKNKVSQSNLAVRVGYQF
jgi:opacity protein-like surface antigen